MDGYRPFAKIYDRCAYKGCSNGKHTNHRLFTFPALKDPRQAIWIQNSGNDHLSSWSASTLRRAGLCPVHFAPDSFIIGNKRKLIPTAVPLPWTKERNAIVDLDDAAATSSFEEANLVQSMNQVDSVPSTCCNKDRDFPTAEDAEIITVQQGAIPVRAYKSGNLDVSNEDEDNPKWMALEPEESRDIAVPAVQVGTEDTLTVALHRIIKLEKANKNMKTQNEGLRRQLRTLRKKLKRVERDSRPASKEMSADDFLDQQGCTQPAARAMVKLQLHQPRVAYSPEEKDLARQLYYHSAATYSRLRRAGCNFPGESSVRRWVSEYDIRCGLSDCILERLAGRLARLPPEERVCALKCAPR